MSARRGLLEVVCGPMFCGKTEELIRRLRRAAISSQVMCFKPEIDKRYHATCIASHAHTTFDSVPVKNAEDILSTVQLTASGFRSVVGIDEVQMFTPAILPVVESILSSGRNVIAAGLDLDYNGEPFGIMPTLMAKADKLQKLSSICVVCFEEATRSYRKKGTSSDLIAVGGTEMYEARCSNCHQLEH